MSPRRVKTGDLSAWARRHSAAYAGMGPAVQRSVSDGVSILLSEAIKRAPKHTGALKRSLRVNDRRKGNSVEMAIASDDPAAGMQESGGVLLAHRRLMTVPIGSERAYWDASGTRREPRSIPGLFRIRARNGRQYLVTRAGRRLVLRFALRHRVWQRGQGWATEAIRAALPQLQSRIEARLADELLASGAVSP